MWNASGPPPPMPSNTRRRLPDRQAIRAAHIEAGEADPAASEGVRRVLRGLSRQRAGAGEASGGRAHRRSAGRDPSRRRQPPHGPHQPDGIPRSGPDPGSRPVPREGDRRCCPENPPREPGSGRPRVRPPLRRSVARRLAAMARAAGLEGAFSGHSARIGMARDLVASGASVAAVQIAGRWASARMPAHYARGELAARGAVARFYGE